MAVALAKSEVPADGQKEERNFQDGNRVKNFLRIFGAVLLTWAAMCCPAAAAQYSDLYVFASQANGDTPRGTLFQDAHGNLYGTTVFGGAWNGETGCECGNVFKVDTEGTETVLYTFHDSGDGAYPYSGVVQDASGNLYGTTYGDQSQSFGSLYRLDEHGTFAALHTFCSQPHCVDGRFPVGGLVLDQNGNLYGTTAYGGANGYGTIFQYSANGVFKVLYSFRNGDDGGYTFSDLIADSKGNLYGMAHQAGKYGGGTVFTFTRKNRYIVLHNFSGGTTDGASPEFGLTRDRSGNLYGTTSEGGSAGCGNTGCGTIFKIAPDKTETILYSFQGGVDGSTPSGLVLDKRGNLYGGSRPGTNQNYQGAIFKLASGGAFSILRNVTCQVDGCLPFDSLIKDKSGTLYGTMSEGGTNSCGGLFCGTVFKVVP